jgi:hypothetical protein
MLTRRWRWRVRLVCVERLCFQRTRDTKASSGTLRVRFRHQLGGSPNEHPGRARLDRRMKMRWLRECAILRCLRCLVGRIQWHKTLRSSGFYAHDSSRSRQRNERGALGGAQRTDTREHVSLLLRLDIREQGKTFPRAKYARGIAVRARWPDARIAGDSPGEVVLDVLEVRSFNETWPKT